MIFGGKDKKAPEKPRPRAKAPTEIETVLGPNTSIQGELCSSGGVRVDGDFGGTIDIAGNLVVGRNAQVKHNTVYTVNAGLAENIPQLSK